MFRLRFSLISFVFCSVFCLLPGSRASANPLDDAKRALAQAQRDLNSAKDAVNRAANAYNAAVADVNRRQHDLSQALATLQAKERTLGSDHDLLIAAQHAFTQASDEVARLRNDLNVKQNALNAAESFVNRLLASDIVLYDMKWSIRIEYNSSTGSFNAWAELPDGLKVTSSAIKAAFHGDVPLPEIDPAEMVATAFGFQLDRQCTFDDAVAKVYRDAGSNASVYVSTRGLAELLSPEHAADATVKAVISGGSTIEGSFDEVAQGCLDELNGAYTFLRQTASNEADKLLSNLMDAMITGANLDSPTVQIKPFVAQMNYTVRLTDGSKQLLKYLPSLQKQIDKVGLTYSFPRPGFAVVVKNHPVPVRSALRTQIGTIKSLDPQALKTALPAASYQLLEPVLSSGSVDPTATITASLESLFKNLDYSALSVDAAFPYCLELSGTPVQTELERLTRNLKIGNQGQAKVSRLSFNFHTGQVSVALDMQAKDVTTLQAALKIVGKTIEEVSDDAVRTWKTAIADVEKAREKVDDAVKTLNAESAVVAKRTSDLFNAQTAVNAATAARNGAKNLLDGALVMENHRSDDLRNARKALADVQSRIGDLERLIQRLSHLIPHITITRPHPFPRPHF